jgi:hypothetical protein
MDRTEVLTDLTYRLTRIKKDGLDSFNKDSGIKQQNSNVAHVGNPDSPGIRFPGSC